jgi:hypothetical protein
MEVSGQPHTSVTSFHVKETSAPIEQEPAGLQNQSGPSGDEKISPLPGVMP